MTGRRPYVDRPVIDRARATEVARRAAATWRLPTPELVRVGMNAIFAAGDTVLRVGHATASAASAQQLVGILIDHGVPAAAPVEGCALDDGDLAVTAWQRLVPTGQPVDWVSVGAAVARLHRIRRTDLPVDYPLPSPPDFPWWDFDALLDEVADRIDHEALAGLRAAIDDGRWWATAIVDDVVVCHGDVHPGNVMMTAEGPRLIDFDLMCTAAPAWDHAMLTTYADRWGGPPDAYDAFAAGYGASLSSDRLTATVARLRNVAATLMRVRAGIADEAARLEADRRLRYWRGDPDAPTWCAQ